MTPPRRASFDLGADEIVTAAIEILQESGLDAVSMRSVATRLGVSPFPLYSRVGNKEALLDAMVDHLLADLTPPSHDDEPWDHYALRWAHDLRTCLRRAHDSRLILWMEREAFVRASRPLVDAMRRDGFDADAAVQGCRLLMWATVGFLAVESKATPPRPGGRTTRPGGDPHGVQPGDIDTLFDVQIRYVIEGIVRDHSATVTRRPRRG